MFRDLHDHKNVLLRLVFEFRLARLNEMKLSIKFRLKRLCRH